MVINGNMPLNDDKNHDHHLWLLQNDMFNIILLFPPRLQYVDMQYIERLFFFLKSNHHHD